MDWLGLAKEYGPAALSVVGSILGVILTFFMAAVRWAWKKHTTRMNQMTKAISELAEAISDTGKDHGKIKDAVTALRAELHLQKNEINPLRAGILSLEGAIKHQQATINSYVERMGVVSGKLDAVFRFMDAPKRSSD